MGRTSEDPVGRLRLNYRRARLLRISAELERWREAYETRSVEPTPPHLGWIRYVRDALDMNGFQLARRAGVRQPTVARLEQKEREETITLRALRRAAHALGCELFYALVPRSTLRELQEAQVRRAVAEMGRGSPCAPEDTEELVRELLVRMPRWIWGSFEYPALYGMIEPGTDAKDE
jgi:predicted DNA-binding mobile mystery protein A